MLHGSQVVLLYSPLQAARDYGYTLLSRSPHQCCMSTPNGNVIKYEVLHMLEFDSNRKCMSIIVREQGQSQVVLYSKGADSVVYRNLSNIIVESGLEKRSYFSLPHKTSPPGSTHAEVLRSKSVPDGSSAADDGSSGVFEGRSEDISINDGGSGRLDADAASRRAEGVHDEGDGSEAGDSSIECNGTRKKSRRDLLKVTLMRDTTQNHIDDYAKLGLRTLCMAKRVSCLRKYSLLDLYKTFIGADR